MDCKEFSKYMGDYVNRTLSPEKFEPANAHLDACDQCTALVKEMEAASAMVKSLDRFCAPACFEDRLRERIAAESLHVHTQTKAGILYRLQSAFGRLVFGKTSGKRTALRPTLAGLACALAVGGVVFFGQLQPQKPAMDWAYIDTCREQHDAFASANPLADNSAIMLNERANDLSSD